MYGQYSNNRNKRCNDDCLFWKTDIALTNDEVHSVWGQQYSVTLFNLNCFQSMIDIVSRLPHICLYGQRIIHIMICFVCKPWRSHTCITTRITEKIPVIILDTFLLVAFHYNTITAKQSGNISIVLWWEKGHSPSALQRTLWWIETPEYSRARQKWEKSVKKLNYQCWEYLVLDLLYGS